MGVAFVVAASSAMAAPATLCYSNTTGQVQGLGGSNSLDAWERNSRHWLALQAAQVAYTLSDLESASDGGALLTAHEQFFSRIPPGYEALHYSSRRDSGLKYLMFKPLNPEWPWILSFTGTENMIDWLTDLDLGRSQLAQTEGLIHTFTDCEYTGPDGAPMAARAWIITGHSLGGGLAEAFAYKVQAARRAKGLDPAELELVTFNAFGAQEVAETDPARALLILKDLRAANYFVTGDPVSRIGRHVGLTLELTQPEARLTQMVKRHSLQTVREWVEAHGGFDSARPAFPPSAPFVNGLKKFGVYAKEWPSFLASTQQRQWSDIETLEGALNLLRQRGLSGPYDREANNYIGAMAVYFILQLEKRPQGIMRDLMLERLNRLLTQSARLK